MMSILIATTVAKNISYRFAYKLDIALQIKICCTINIKIMEDPTHVLGKIKNHSQNVAIYMKQKKKCRILNL